MSLHYVCKESSLFMYKKARVRRYLKFFYIALHTTVRCLLYTQKQELKYICSQEGRPYPKRDLAFSLLAHNGEQSYPAANQHTCSTIIICNATSVRVEMLDNHSPDGCKYLTDCLPIALIKQGIRPPFICRSFD